jgi:hypothetical protein
MIDMKKSLFVAFFCCVAFTMVSAQENTHSESWVYMTAEDFVNDNRQFAGEYTVAPAEGQSRYKDSLEVVYTPARIDGDRKADASKQAWGVSCDGQLYVNNAALNGGKGYTKSFSPGRYNLFFATVNDSGAAKRKYGYTDDDVRFYGQEQGKHRGTVNVGGIPIGLGSTKPLSLPIVIDRQTGEMRAVSQAYMRELGARHSEATAVPMNEARGERLIGYFRQLNALK